MIIVLVAFPKAEAQTKILAQEVRGAGDGEERGKEGTKPMKG